MKIFFYIALLLISAGCANTNTILVLDANGNPVPQAEVTYFVPTKIIKPITGKGTTDYLGVFRLKGLDWAYITARKDGLWGNGKFYPPQGVLVLDPNSKDKPFGSYKTPDELRDKAYELYIQKLNKTSTSNQNVDPTR